MPDNEDRLKQFEDTLATTLHPQVAKFAPKKALTETTIPPMAARVAEIREQAQVTLKLCDEIDKLISAGEDDARKAADLLIAMAARIK